MVARGDKREIAIIIGHAQAVAQILDQTDAALLMPDMLRPFLFGRRAFAEVVQQRRKTYARVLRQSDRLVQHQHGMNTRIHLGMVRLGLRHPVQRVDPQAAEHRRL